MSDARGANDEHRASPGGHLRIVRGEPTPEELAAVLAIVTAASAAAPAPVERVRRGGWNDPAATHRRPLLPGPNAWRASALP